MSLEEEAPEHFSGSSAGEEASTADEASLATKSSLSLSPGATQESFGSILGGGLRSGSSPKGGTGAKKKKKKKNNKAVTKTVPRRGEFDSTYYPDKIRQLKRELRAARLQAAEAVAENDALRVSTEELRDALNAVARPLSRGPRETIDQGGQFGYLDRNALISMLETTTQQVSQTTERLTDVSMQLKQERARRQRLEAEVFAKQKLLDKAEKDGLTGLQLLAAEHQEMTTELERLRVELADSQAETSNLAGEFEQSVRVSNENASRAKQVDRERQAAEERMQRVELHARHRERVMAMDTLTLQCNEGALQIQELEHRVRIESSHPNMDAPGDVNARRRVRELQRELAEQRGAQQTRVAYLLSLQQQEDVQVALYEGAVFGDLRKSRDALDQGALINMGDAQGRTALFHAAGNGQQEVLGLLLDEGAHIVVDSDLEPPLVGAARGGHVGCVQLLVAAGVDLEATDSSQRTALVAAAAQNQAGVLVELLRSGARPNHAAHDGGTALHVACRLGFEAAATILLQFGADETLITKNGDTARELAAENRHSRLLRLLDEHSAEQACLDCAALAQMSAQGTFAPAAAAGSGTRAGEVLCPKHATPAGGVNASGADADADADADAAAAGGVWGSDVAAAAASVADSLAGDASLLISQHSESSRSDRNR